MFSRDSRRAVPNSALLATTALITMIGVVGTPTFADALAPPSGRYSYGAAGTARNGFGGEIAASPTVRSWPGTGLGGNGGPFAFVGAQYGGLWNIPPSANNSRGVGYCVMEDVTGEGTVSLQPDPAVWDIGDMARAAALMTTFGGDRVTPYGVSDAGAYNVGTGEWENQLLFSGSDFTRRRQVAVNFGIRIFLEDVSPRGVVRGLKLARDVAVVDGARGDFAALGNGYRVAQYMAQVAEQQSAVGELAVRLVWGTPDGNAPTGPGVYPLEVRTTDASGKQVGLVPVLQLSDRGDGGDRSVNAIARVDNSADSAADSARWDAATSAGWPNWVMTRELTADPQFSVGTNPSAADVADASGVARFNVEITGADWDLAFQVLAPTSNVDLFAGSGIQGQVTWSGPSNSAVVHERFASPVRFIAVAKTSTDPTVSVAGTTFALYDGSLDEITRAAVGEDGRASFAGFSPARFEPPYVLRELSAADGLEPIDGDIAVPSANPLSVDSAQPTIVEVENNAIVGQFRILKRLDDADVQGTRDMSGFAFEVIQVATGRVVAELTTNAEGRTAPFDAVLGDYEIVEMAKPDWAEGLVDQGAVTMRLEPSAEPSDIVYTNSVPEATMATSARDLSDGDKYVLFEGDDPEAGASVVDTISYCGLVPGTEYIARGSIQIVVDGTATTASDVSGSVKFVPDSACGSVDVVFEVPSDSPLRGGIGVVFEQLVLQSGGAIVAEHADPRDLDQTVYFPTVQTLLRLDDPDSELLPDRDIAAKSGGGPTLSDGKFVRPGVQLVDEVAYSGLAVGARYRAELTLQARDSTGICTATDSTGYTEFSAESSTGFVAVTGITVPAAGVFVGFERIYLVDPPGADQTQAGDNEGPVPVAAHEDCDDRRQTVWAPGMDTRVAAAQVVGAGEMTDAITVVGMSDGLPSGVTAVIEGGLYRHGDPNRSTWVCDSEGLQTEFSVVVATDGDYESAGESHELGWYSYDSRFVVTFADGSTWTSDPFGCRVPAESFEATSSPAAPTSTTVAPSSPAAPSGNSQAPMLPRTGGGNSGRLQLLGVLLVLAGGSLLLVTPVRRKMPGSAR